MPNASFNILLENIRYPKAFFMFNVPLSCAFFIEVCNDDFVGVYNFGVYTEQNRSSTVVIAAIL